MFPAFSFWSDSLFPWTPLSLARCSSSDRPSSIGRSRFCLRSIGASPELLESATIPDKSPALFPLFAIEEKDALTDEEKAATVAEFDNAQPSLSKYYPPGRADRPTLPPCLKALHLSGWNPPPGNRRLQGELFYIEVETIETRKAVITASTSGFFVNQSGSSFNPSMEKSYKKVSSFVHCEFLSSFFLLGRSRYFFWQFVCRCFSPDRSTEGNTRNNNENKQQQRKKEEKKTKHHL